MSAKIPLLVMGTATDGPAYTVYQPTSWSAARRFFGGEYTQRYFIYNNHATTGVAALDILYLTTWALYPTSPANRSSTAFTLDYLPWGSVEDTLETRRGLLPRYLYNLQVSGRAVSFGAIQATGAYGYFTYQPFLGQGDLLAAAETLLVSSGKIPAMLRVGGSYAARQIGGWEFRARYPGLLYNKILLTFTSSSLRIDNPIGKGPYTLTYALTGNYAERLERDYLSGKINLKITAGPSGLAGSYNLIGGGDGELSTSTISEALSGINLADIGAILLPTWLTSALFNAISSQLAPNWRPPTIIFTQCRTPQTQAEQEDLELYVSNLADEIPDRHEFLMTVAGSSLFRFTDGVPRWRSAAEAAAGAYLRNPNLSITNQSTYALDYTPTYSASDLNLLYSAGINSLNRFIASDISVWRGISSTGTRGFDWLLLIQESAIRSYRSLSRWIGSTFSDTKRAQAQADLVNALSNLPFGQLVEAKVTWSKDRLYADISLNLQREILTISISVAARAS
jgi:hypothetical protein